jgi:hypothetical protein
MVEVFKLTEEGKEKALRWFWITSDEKLIWDGRDEIGRDVESGDYLLRFYSLDKDGLGVDEREVRFKVENYRGPAPRIKEFVIEPMSFPAGESARNIVPC